MIEQELYEFINRLLNIYSEIELHYFTSTIINVFFIPVYVLFTYILLSIYMYQKSRLQLMLSNLGLENYRLKKIKKSYLLQLKYGEEMSFDYIESISDDIRQRLKIEKPIYIKRYKKKDVLIEIEKDFDEKILLENEK